MGIGGAILHESTVDRRVIVARIFVAGQGGIGADNDIGSQHPIRDSVEVTGSVHEGSFLSQRFVLVGGSSLTAGSPKCERVTDDMKAGCARVGAGDAEVPKT